MAGWMSKKTNLALATAVVGIVPFVGMASANAAGNTVYVSHRGWSGNSDSGCATARYHRIQAAIDAVPAGGTVVVCSGVYYQSDIRITKPVKLIGQQALIDASHAPTLAPLPGGVGIVVRQTHDVLISGVGVRNAPFDGITVGGSRNVRVTHGFFTGNGDVGVDLNGSSWSRIDHTVSRNNVGGGFLVADDLGPNTHNLVDWNVVTGNAGGCGIIVAGHSTSGVTWNVIAHNVVDGNGLNPQSSGAGVLIATGVPGESVAHNTVAWNTINGNGISGVTVHAHTSGENLNGNRIIGNTIGRNNVLGDPIGLAPPVTNVPDMRTTGILVASSSALSILIAGNRIHDDHYGAFIEGRVTVTFSGNAFWNVPVPVTFK
jgi:hypothetical protein